MSDRIIEFTVPAGAKAGRADKIFASEFDDISRARLQRAFDAGQVTFDGVTIDKRFKVNREGVLRAVLEEPTFDASPVAVDLPLDIIYEDESILVVNKAPGMIVHPGSGTGDNTLVHALLHHCGENLSTIGAPNRPGIVHRLDKETSGLIIIAKNDTAHHKLAAEFSERRTYKRYTALVFGHPKVSRGTIQEPIGRHRVVRTRMAVVHSGKPAHTDWKVEERYKQKASRISCVIHTGRTHQIRVHMSEIRFPLLGDTTYGFKPARLVGVTVPRVMLHSTELHIQHPDRDELMQFQAPLPADFETLIGELS
ncbi:RluA family pseudouridine synthase [Coraliomargarita sp. SDUM461003]|uniref:Pseudouridine synthase n=1 Tax=Thalassobacterium maritimum TaxID=3041265 RepID=A0ABU1ASS8_9BACT|nr:RluA family pseudouridine synthase [Coraliomargarita sp. SDUM461003]MBT61839.1 RNA pseudouridine synthase [Puniceicoccaceae bacterium]MDQ8207203.1 RluA family pseudouridine synthase [Coraliomargarita sp. SDUM461003]HBR92668.1 RluA family pseudouridine synthase [Opitutae bacterium]|tara:strand:- start:695 stop:1624 length:930 start_codon:yes stop_codon:yes gene_type:complete